MPRQFDEKAYATAGRELKRRCKASGTAAVAKASGTPIQHVCNALAGTRRIPPKLFAWLQK